ncbi:aldo-keto reductase family 1 member A1 [Zeugodacus cucurbitae]|uniref:Alcohol dehydrogenase [NADP(+)] n=1 Tax=Zeugodacus cucurbitae TaxID=28588 RepID=A0A0A1WYA1_ZEUCU|nr:aldo-keto reductase family 1 member A1 [Zeugodacus cucurbitae]
MAVPFSLTLNDGNKMPSIGINTWNLDIEDLDFVIKEALFVGFRHIDTSVFNLNEKLLGKVLKNLIAEEKIKRTDLFITTKLPPTANKPELVETALLQSLNNLQLEYVDLYLIQLPVALVYDESFEVIKRQKNGLVCFENTDHVLVWQKMEDLVIRGLAKSIGLANFNMKQITNIICNSNIPPAVLQIEYHIYLQQPELVQFCQTHRITITSFASLGTHDMMSSNYFLTKHTHTPSLLEVAEVRDIARKYKKTETQVLIRWILAKNCSALLRMSNSRRMHEIMGIYDFILGEEDVQILDALDRNMRCVNFGFLSGIESHPQYPF